MNADLTPEQHRKLVEDWGFEYLPDSKLYCHKHPALVCQRCANISSARCMWLPQFVKNDTQIKGHKCTNCPNQCSVGLRSVRYVMEDKRIQAITVPPKAKRREASEPPGDGAGEPGDGAVAKKARFLDGIEEHAEGSTLPQNDVPGIRPNASAGPSNIPFGHLPSHHLSAGHPTFDQFSFGGHSTSADAFASSTLDPSGDSLFQQAVESAGQNIDSEFDHYLNLDTRHAASTVGAAPQEDLFAGPHGDIFADPPNIDSGADTGAVPNPPLTPTPGASKNPIFALGGHTPWQNVSRSGANDPQSGLESQRKVDALVKQQGDAMKALVSTLLAQERAQTVAAETEVTDLKRAAETDKKTISTLNDRLNAANIKLGTMQDQVQRRREKQRTDDAKRLNEIETLKSEVALLQASLADKDKQIERLNNVLNMQDNDAEESDGDGE